MSRATFTFEESGERRYLTISNHGYYMVFDADLRDDVSVCFTIVVRGHTGGKMKAHDDYMRSILYKGSCKRGVVDGLEMGALQKKADRLFATYLQVMERRRNANNG